MEDRRIRRTAILAALAATVALALPAGEAKAFGFLDALFGTRPAPVAPPPMAMPYPAPGTGLTVTVTPPGMEQSFSTGGKVHCVRTCDGRHFPMAATGGNAANLCAAMCPAADTKVFRGADIEHAVANDGQRYTKLPNAFAYRTKAVEGCTCNGGQGLAMIDVMADPTLKPGDIVMTETGPITFKGARRKTYTTADFVPGSKLPPNMSPVRPLPDLVRTTDAGAPTTVR
jgi:hypothetical protein